MKFRLPSRLVQALLTTCAAAMTTSTSALAEVPEGYEPVIITDVDQLADYTESDYIAFIINSDITNNAHRMTGAHQYWSDAVFHSHTLTFAEQSGGAIYGSDYSSISLEGNKNVVFSGNYAQHGSAIYGESYSTINLTSNDSVVFSENNSTSFGGAIFTARNSSSISITENAAVMFNNNNTNSYGGAIFAYGTVSFTGNDSVTFSENSAPKSAGDGGAIWVSSATNFTENGTVMFNNNTADTFGGAIYGIAGTVSFTNNKAVTFNGNAAKYGGAIDAGSSTFCFANNEAVTFSSNSSTETGGAIYGGSSISLTGNDSVTFSGNAAKYGGAIYTFRTVSIQDNDSVTFRGNYEKTESGDSLTYRLRSVYIAKGSDSTLTLAAGKGQNITFYDTLYASMGTEVSFNASYQDMVGVTQDAMGDIVFSGAHAEADLKKLKAGPTQQELTDSLTTEVYATTNLYGGRLRVEDGAIYKGNGISVAAGSNATLRLSNASLVLTNGITVGSIANISGRQSYEISASKSIDISETKMNGSDGMGALSGVTVDIIDNYTIENMCISGSVIKIGEGATLYLVNVDIKSDTHITDDPARVFVQGTNVQLEKTNTWVDKEITAAQDMQLYICGDTQRSITLAVGSEIVELTSSMFDSVTLTGSDLWLDMTGIATQAKDYDYIALDFQDFAREMAKAQVDVENLHVYATLDGEKYTEAYSTANGGLTTTLYFQVPEPSTGTLSLLALAALAARRRR